MERRDVPNIFQRISCLSLQVAAASVADVAQTDDMAKYEAATLFVTVTSQGGIAALVPREGGQPI